MNENPLISKFRNELLKRGPSGIKSIGQYFRQIDDNGSRTLTFEEFGKGIIDHNVKISAEEASELFRYFDKNQNGQIDYEEFLVNVRPPMNNFRLNLISKAFQRMDRTGDGRITFEDLKGVYKVNKHPRFLSGEMNESQIFRQFLDEFDASSHKDGTVTFQEFVDYFAGVSASIDTDIYFDCMMRQCWKI
ncbi:unnamed protein product [Brachionus calyciflorus]|uniref:EF-hand domain-containing protein n=1 Tax=Brachionus calyciflorus TaxID=104777 RepID=A0A813M5E4_9BILA|nr:unnamed protein product [Brachionus calyciflorus]